MVDVDVVAVAIVEAHVEIAGHVEACGAVGHAEEGVPQVGIGTLDEEGDGGTVGQVLALQRVRDADIALLAVGPEGIVNHLAVAQHVALLECGCLGGAVL